MALATGQSLSFYEILGPLGVGAMGEVYQARDTRLGREVAIKVLPEHFAEDEERLRRFEREARSLASLNHPNVAQIFGVDQVGDLCFLVLELVPGATLEERLAAGPLSPNEAVEVCRQIAEALEAAHAAGVIHRDLKPANVRITPDGKVKVLDFGLAKPVGEGAPDSSIDSALATEAGRLLGTPTYMAPEQARGKPIDRRVDVWAFGCVLYECLTGRRAFGGETVSDVLAAVLQEEPDLGRLPADLAAGVREVLELCLAKDPRERLRDVGDASLLLARPSADAAPAATRRPVAAAFALGALVTGAAWFVARTYAPEAAERDDVARPGRTYRFPLELEQEVGDLWVSPDGTRVLYRHDGALRLRRFDEERSEPVPGTEQAWPVATWSPDGRSIAFGRGAFLETLDLGGAGSVRRCRVPAEPSVLSWGSRDSILFEVHATPGTDGIYLHRAGANEPEFLDWIDSAQQISPDLAWPSFLPDGERFLLTRASDDDAWVHVASVETRTTRPLLRSRTRAAYVEPGWLAWGDGGRLLVQPFDAATAALTGAPRALVDGIDAFESTGRVRCRFSSDGTLAYRPRAADAVLEWVSRDGRRLGAAGSPRTYEHVRLDPDGTRIVTSIDEPTTGLDDVWIVDLERDTPRRVTHHPRWEGEAVWSRDGSRIVFQADWSGPPNLYEQEVGGAEARELVPYDGTVLSVGGFGADGREFVYDRLNEDDLYELWIVDTETLERRALPSAPFSRRDPVVSGDGRWMAYVSDETGRYEVYVASFPDLTGTQRVSTGGGAEPRWPGEGSELFFVTGTSDVVAVTLAEENGRIRPEREDVIVSAAEDLIDYDVAHDGQRLLLLRSVADSGRRQWRVITDWSRLLER